MKKILVVEDHPMIRHLIQLTLEFENYAVIEAIDAHQAIEQAKLFCPSLILLDINLPGAKNGLELCVQLKELPCLKDTQYIILTASDAKPHRERAQQLGIDNYLTKPFRPSQLIETVQHLI